MNNMQNMNNPNNQNNPNMNGNPYMNGMQNPNMNYTNNNQNMNNIPPYMYGFGINNMQQTGPGLAIASMVLGILSVIFSCCYSWFSFILGTLAVVFGAIALTKKHKGKGMAIAGLVCGIVCIVMIILAFILVIFDPEIYQEMRDDYYGM